MFSCWSAPLLETMGVCSALSQCPQVYNPFACNYNSLLIQILLYCSAGPSRTNAKKTCWYSDSSSTITVPCEAVWSRQVWAILKISLIYCSHYYSEKNPWILKLRQLGLNMSLLLLDLAPSVPCSRGWAGSCASRGSHFSRLLSFLPAPRRMKPGGFAHAGGRMEGDTSSAYPKKSKANCPYSWVFCSFKQVVGMGVIRVTWWHHRHCLLGGSNWLNVTRTAPYSSARSNKCSLTQRRSQGPEMPLQNAVCTLVAWLPWVGVRFREDWAVSREKIRVKQKILSE